MSARAERLKGDLRLRSGGLAPAHLVLDDEGLWLRDHSNPEPEVRIDVLEARPLAYLEGTFGDELRIGETSYGVPTGRGDAIQRLFADARLPAPRAERPPAKERFLDKRDPLEDHWLRGWLEDGEPLLAWLRLGQKTRVTSSIGPDEERTGAFVLTPRRAALVAVGAFGDTKVLALPDAALRVGDGIRRPVVAGDTQFYASAYNGDRFEAVAEWCDGSAAERAFALARAIRDDEVTDARRAALFAVAAGSNPDASVLGGLYAALVEPPAGVATLLASEDPREALFALWDRWSLGPERGARLVRWVTDAPEGDAAAAALALHDHVHKARLAAAKGGFAPAAIDLSFAEHLLAQRAYDRAITLLESRLMRLPSEELADLVPNEAPAEAEPDVGHGAQLMRIAVLDRLADARGRGEGRDAATVAELARLMPLVPERLRELATARSGKPAERARRYREVLAERRWSQPAPPLPHIAVHPLGLQNVEQVLRHPLSRKGHALGQLSGLLAEVEVPDVTALKAYCERLDQARADAHNALSDAMRALSIPACTAYVSRGDKSVGLRSYEGDEPFVLIGAEHLRDGSPRHLGATELRFALAAELAHLRFGHSRVTSTDIWVGALSKSKRGFDAIAGLLPAWRLLKVAEKASTLASYYQDGTVEWAVNKIGKLTGWSPFGASAASEKRLSADPEDLIAAARVMQLTADRAGLLMCGDLHAAVRAICLTHEDYDGVLTAADARSLSAVLAERDDDGNLARQTLAIRVAALIAFHLSDEWDALRAALETPTELETATE